MAEKIFEVEFSPDDGLVLRIHPPKALVTGSAGEHLKTSAKEMLLSVRSLVDAALKVVEEKEGTGKKTSTKIDIK